MKTQQRLIALLAILVTVLAYASFAASTGDTQNQILPVPPQGPIGGLGGPQMRAPGMAPRGLPLLGALRTLDLTTDQQTAVKAIVEKNRDTMQAAGKAVAEANKAFRDAVVGDANEPAIRTAAAAVATAMADHAVLQVKTSIAIKALLTKEQLQKLTDMQAQIKNRPAGPQGGPMDGQRRGFGRPGGPMNGPRDGFGRPGGPTDGPRGDFGGPDGPEPKPID